MKKIPGGQNFSKIEIKTNIKSTLHRQGAFFVQNGRAWCHCREDPRVGGMAQKQVLRAICKKFLPVAFLYVINQEREEMK